MKKFFLFGIIAFAALSVTSCTKDEVIEIMPQEAIEFGTYLGHDVQSRGVVLDNNNFNQFGVFASYTDGNWNPNSPINFMFNQVVNKSGNNWTYSPLKYWPADQSYKVSFFAYAPYAASDNGISLVTQKNGAGAPQILYTINDADLGKMADFVADVEIDHSKQAGDEQGIDNDNETVNFVLNHELTRVNILAKLDRNAFGDADANKTKVNIKSVTFLGGKFATEGIYTFASENDGVDNQGVTTTVKRGTWDVTTSAGAPSGITLDIANALNVQVDEDLDPYKTEGVSVGTTEAVPLFKTTQYLFLIPVAGESGLTTAGDVKMKIAYDIVTVDSAVNGGYTATPAVKEISLPAGALKQGVAYEYTLTFGLNEIVLSATVGDWDTENWEEDVDWDDVDVQ